MRPNQRQADQLRDIQFIRNFTEYAEGSVLTCFGKTKVLCTVSIASGVPRFLRDSGQGWLTAEYGMLPRSTHDRMDREAAKGKQKGRTVEIQRLIGRSLRAVLDLKKLGEFTVQIDCDVIQADGGTRTAAISGACVALVDALNHLQRKGLLMNDPFLGFVSAVSVGVVDGQPMLDLEYTEDCRAETDMNVVMTEQGSFIEVQGTAEQAPFSRDELGAMIDLAEVGTRKIIEQQKQVLAQA